MPEETAANLTVRSKQGLNSVTTIGILQQLWIDNNSIKNQRDWFNMYLNDNVIQSTYMTAQHIGQFAQGVHTLSKLALST
jgi:hypothetical protein